MHKLELTTWLQDVFINHKDDVAVIIEKNKYSFSDLYQKICEIHHNEPFMVIKDQRSFTTITKIIYCLYNKIPYTVISEDWPELKIEQISSDFKHFIEHNDDPDHIAYVLYTSGSTGKPKGVCISRPSLATLFNNLNDIMEKTGGLVLSVTPLSFDLSVHDTLAPLFYGKGIYFTQNSERSKPETVSDIITKNRLTGIATTPTNYNLYHYNKNENVCCCVVGGEKLTFETWQHLKNVYPNATIINCYGPTEATVWISSHDCTDEFSLSVGKPFSNIQVKTDKFGELLISGNQLALGYTNQLLTHSAFYTDNDIRWYRTGDRAEIINSNIIVQGRLDRQVKRLGHRIELDEIETTIHDNKNIKSRAIYSNEQLILALETSPSQHEEISELLKSILPFYSQPDKIVFFDNFPVNDNGKTSDQLILTTITEQNRTNDICEQVLHIWNEIFGFKPQAADMNRNISEFGVSSIQIARLLTQYKSIFGLSVPLSYIAKGKSILEHITFLEQKLDKQSLADNH